MNERERLIYLLERMQLNAKNMAEQSGIKPSTLSNILSGRNNPSLDVMQRILSSFPNVSPAWLILGSGDPFMKNDNVDNVSSNIFGQTLPQTSPLDSSKDLQTIHSNTEKVSHTLNYQSDNFKRKNNEVAEKEKKIVNIVVFYSDGTYDIR